ncbi:hypothetical protein MHU86_19415 [Fragilaria crotonensis]|nr:hypothetical protein MHU86_19415 [Fragilaria crotonensis]
MSNPVTTWIKSIMENDEERDAEFEDRVASTSVLAAKLVDQRNTPHRYSGYYKEDFRTRGFDHFFYASSTLKANVGGIRSSGYAMEFYNDLAEKKLAKVIAKCKEQA